jgi:hypothetical protein
VPGFLRRIERWIALHPVRFAVAFAIVVVGVGLLLEIGFETNDDVAMMWVADGTTYGSRQSTLVFSSSLIGGVLAWLYGVAAAVPWYGLYLITAMAITSGIVAYVVVADLRTPLAPRLALLAGLAGAFLVPRTVALQFTSTSLLLGGAGVVLYLARAHRPRTGMAAALIGGAALGVAGLIRLRGAQGIVVLLLPLLVIAVWRIPWRRQAAFAAMTIGLLLTGMAVDAAAYDDAWDDWREFNAVRGRLHSSRVLAAAEGQPALDEAGWTTNDLRMFREWFFTDEQVYDTASLRVVAQVDAEASLALIRPQVTGVVPISRLILLVAALAAALAVSTRRGGAVVAGSVAWMALVAGYLALYERFPDRIAVPILALSGAVLLARPAVATRADGDEVLRRFRWPAAIVAAVALLVLAVGIVDLANSRANRTTSQERLERFHDQVARIDENGTFLSLAGAIPTQLVSPTGAPDLDPAPDLIPLGWQTQSPPHDALLRRHGIEDAYLAVADDPDVYLIASRYFPPTLFMRYMEQHYGRAGVLVAAGRVGGRSIIAYERLIDFEVTARGIRTTSGGETTLVPFDDTLEGRIILTPNRVESGRLSGWAVDPATGERPMFLVTVDGEVVTATLATRTRTDVAERFGLPPSRRLAFLYRFPGEIPDGFAVYAVIGDRAIDLTPGG